jgi:hypothetical protein
MEPLTASSAACGYTSSPCLPDEDATDDDPALLGGNPVAYLLQRVEISTANGYILSPYYPPRFRPVRPRVLLPG